MKRKILLLTLVALSVLVFLGCPQATDSPKDLTINIPEITGINPPELGLTPPPTTITETPQYTGIVTWSPDANNGFEANTDYTAIITLKAKKGYTFTGVSENFFIVDGATSVTNEANSGIVEAIFPKIIVEEPETFEPNEYEKFYPKLTASIRDRGLPIVYIDTEDEQIVTSKESYLPTKVRIVDNKNQGNNFSVENFKDAGIRGRGNSTWSYPKKPFRIKFDKKQSLFGLTKAKNWVLLANWQDPTFIMNTLTFELGKTINGNDSDAFVHSAIHVDLVFNGIYMGSYVLTEHKQVAKGRVDIDEEKGFLVELDSYYDEDPKFRTENYELPVMIKTPEFKGNLDANTEDYKFVRDKVNELCDLLANDGAENPNDDYKNIIDLQSFVNFILTNEIVRNNELGHPKSTFMYMDKDGPICMGPLWDFDWAFSYSGKGFSYFGSYTGLIGKHDFFKRFFDDPAFVSLYKNTWNAKKEEIRDLTSFIESHRKLLRKSHFADTAICEKPYDFDEELDKMKTWWENRVDYLDTEINKL